jgi:hypothetical protein
LAASAVARELLAPNPNDTDINRQLRTLSGDSEGLHRIAQQIASTISYPSPEEFLRLVLSACIDRLIAENCSPPPTSVFDAFSDIVIGLYDLPELAVPPPRPPDILLHTIDGARWRDATRVYISHFSNPHLLLTLTAAAFLESLYEFIRALPPSILISWDEFAEEWDDLPPTSFRVPLTDVTGHPGSLITTILLPFYSPGVVDNDLFVRLRAHMNERVDQIGYMPENYRGSPAEVLDTYVARTPFERVFSAEVPLQLPQEQRFAGHWIIAPAGRGKTTLLHKMFLDDLKREASIVIIDSKGELIEPIKNLRAISDRLVLVEPDEHFPLALNPLDIPNAGVMQTIALIEYVMSALLEAKFTPLQSALFRNVIPAIVEAIPNATLDTFKAVITSGFEPFQEHFSRLSARTQAFFLDKQNGFASKTYAETRNQIIWRLDYLMTNPVMRAMFAAAKTKLDLGKEMDAGKIIIINNSKALLTDEGAEFFGRFFIALILAAAQQRASRRPADKLPCYVYIDECHNVIARDLKIPTILDECRSQKIALIMAHQRTAQLTAPVLDAVANCAIRMANSDDEAKYLADKLRTSTEAIRVLPRGTFATFVRDLTPTALALKIPRVDLTALPQISAQQRSVIHERMRQEFGYSPVNLPLTTSSAVSHDIEHPTEPARTFGPKSWGA